jgi:hypothetical protein
VPAERCEIAKYILLMAAADADLTAPDDDARMTADERALDPTGVFGEDGRAGRGGNFPCAHSLAPAGRRKTNLTVAEAPQAQIAKQTYSIPCVLYV